ncbi:protein disulfide isomerase [Stylonychia lemnae]|uniref:Protein disulfide isomerase n=1 Tax=Stylonychia lemnae TaxID=5949 RepID=A0A078A4V1_STYLE|nr:protein disulfide isomerase [Stylonychia lemnae]|eukprot:CDW76595.1 protein disulfide isomerase [Stylonychia lemnae]
MKYYNLISLALIFIAVRAHEEDTSQKDDNKGEVILFNDENYMKLFKEQALAEAKTKPLFVFFLIRDCDSCIHHAKDWIQLSKVTSKQYKIARTDCQFDSQVCPKFQIDQFPFLLLFKNNKIYKYKGGLEFNELLNFLSADNYKEAEIYSENTQDLFLQVSGEYSLSGKVIRLGQDFISWSEKQSKFIFKKIGLYYWSDNSKLLCFTVVTTGTPTVILTFYFMVSCRYLFNLIFGANKPHQHSNHYNQHNHSVNGQKQAQQQENLGKKSKKSKKND